MDTEGMEVHPIFEGLQIVNQSVWDALSKAAHLPTGPSAANRLTGWEREFEQMEDDNAREQAFAVTLGFADASEYHAETDWCDRVGLMVDWYEREDLRP